VILLLANGYWRLAAIIPVARILEICFHQDVAAIRGGFFKIVSPEHPTFMALDFLISEIFFVTVSLLIIRACGYRLSWKRPTPRRDLRRPLRRFANRSAVVAQALAPGKAPLPPAFAACLNELR
jgi:hypothetical protein